MARAQEPETGTREAILREAVGLFARAGYSGVSMRDVAALVGTSAAALYHHFPDKDSLYLAAVEHAFARTSSEIRDALQAGLPPLERLQHFVERFTELAAADVQFRRLVLRELLDGDEARFALLAERVLREPFGAIVELARELGTDLDPHMLANSVIGLVLFSVNSAPLRRHLPGARARNERPAVMADHIATLLRRACAPPDDR